jgi:heme/copper-type cytochrome/quinol oxidase subunit 2
MFVVLLTIALPVALSLAGPIYDGYANAPYLSVLIWAGVCTIMSCWFYRRSFTVAFSDAPYSSAVKLLNIVAIIVAMGLCFLAGDSAAYFIVLAISFRPGLGDIAGGTKTC